jgi:hypothetical protein
MFVSHISLRSPVQYLENVPDLTGRMNFTRMMDQASFHSDSSGDSTNELTQYKRPSP